jgi:hypothetical protein
VPTKIGVGLRVGLNTWVKVEVKVKFALEEVTKAQRGSRGIAVLFIFDDRCGCVVNITRRAAVLQRNAWEKGKVFLTGNRTSILQLSSPVTFVTIVTALSSECTKFP